MLPARVCDSAVWVCPDLRRQHARVRCSRRSLHTRVDRAPLPISGYFCVLSVFVFRSSHDPVGVCSLACSPCTGVDRARVDQRRNHIGSVAVGVQSFATGYREVLTWSGAAPPLSYRRQSPSAHSSPLVVRASRLSIAKRVSHRFIIFSRFGQRGSRCSSELKEIHAVQSVGGCLTDDD